MRVNELMMYGRFLRGLPAFLRHPITLGDARSAIQQRLATREEALLRFVERGVFAAPRSPYPQLFRLAGCDPRDLPALVRDRGVDGALHDLRAAGIYFSFEEFKGQVPVVRGGRELPLQASDFDNPFLGAVYEGHTSGSTGAATRVGTDLEHLALRAQHRLVAWAAHGLDGAPWAIWRPPLPAGSGINNVLCGARVGNPPLRWFTPVVRSDMRRVGKYHLANYAAIACGQLAGVKLPWPEPVRFDEGVRIARWMADTRDRHGRAWINTTVSGGLRIALAASAAGIDLSGATFMLAGEPATPAKIRGVNASGATHFTDYGTVEAGRIGMGCARPCSESDVHLLSDAYAVIPWPRTMPGSDDRLMTFHVTGFHPSSPKLLLNVEFDDYGVIDDQPCGCPLETLGLRTHLRDIRSYEKFTGEGVTLPGSAMIRLLEEVLPRRFGGTPLDYQLLEEEDERGFTRVTLVVSPRIEDATDDELRDTVLESLSHLNVAADGARTFWQQAGTLRVRRADPQVSARGKQATFQSARARTTGRRG